LLLLPTNFWLDAVNCELRGTHTHTHTRERFVAPMIYCSPAHIYFASQMFIVKASRRDKITKCGNSIVKNAGNFFTIKAMVE
jgi:hypothetical protein